MRPSFQRLLTLLTLLTFPLALRPQTCLGYPSLDVIKVNLLGEYQSTPDLTAAGLGASFGVGKRGMVNLGWTRSMFDEGDIGSNGLSLGFGLQRTPKSPERWHLCPVAGLDHEIVDDIDLLGTTFSSSITTLQAGVAVGRVSGSAQSIAVAPFAVLSVALARASVSVAGFSITEQQEFGVLQAGVGAHFSDVLSVRPSVSVPFGLGKPDATLAVTVGLGIRRR